MKGSHDDASTRLVARSRDHSSHFPNLWQCRLRYQSGITRSECWRSLSNKKTLLLTISTFRTA